MRQPQENDAERNEVGQEHKSPEMQRQMIFKMFSIGMKPTGQKRNKKPGHIEEYQ
jgi:hypothetical protein